MKRLLKYLMILPLLATASCVKERAIGGGPVSGAGEKSVMLKVAVPYTAPQGSAQGNAQGASQSAATRSMGPAQENAIATLDILAFKVDGTSETFLYWAQASAASGNTDGASSQAFNTTLLIKDYQQRFVVITNARDRVAALIAGRADGWVGQDKETMLSGLTFDLDGGDRWNAISASNYTAIPMWGQSDPQTISSATPSIGTVSLLRMIAKVEVQVDQSVAGLTDAFKLKSVYVYNTNTSGRIVPIDGNVDATMVAQHASLPASVASVVGPLAYTDFSDPGIPDIAMKGAIYIFETTAKNAGNQLEETCIVVGGVYGTDTAPTYYRLDFLASDAKTYADILRNHRYLFNISAVGGRGYASVDEAYRAKSSNMVVNLLVWDESEIRYIAYDNNYMLGVSQIRFDLSGDAHDSNSTDNILKVATDYPAGWTASVWADEAGTTPVANDATTGAPWLSISPAAGAGGAQLDNTSLVMPANTSGAPRTAWIIVSAGKLVCKVEVVQLAQPIDINTIPGIGTPPAGIIPFVGAFWRAGETGERIIRMNGLNATASNAGPWSASVAWYDAKWNQASGDGIVLSTDMLDATSLATRGITWDLTTENPNSGANGPENYKLTGNVSSVGGVVDATNTGIAFRIGLQKTFGAYNAFNNPARYAVVLLSYGTPVKYQKLFIRQGEGNDYAPGLNSGSGWSPYNLGNSQNFVDFPTQTGYFYQWTNAPTPYHPVNPPGTTPAGWTATGGGSFSLDGVCPAGYAYKLPTGGSTSDMASLMTASHTAGYYADGFFDRRQILQSVTYGALDASYGNSNAATQWSWTTVSSNSADYTDPMNTNAAYIGTIFFSTANNASIFFPSGGTRYGEGAGPGGYSPPGALWLAGRMGGYWSSSVGTGPGSAGTGFAMSLDALLGSAGRGTSMTNFGYSVRCVVDPSMPDPSVQLPDPGAVPDGGTPPAGVTSFVGAFWRASETGERIIHLDNVYGASTGNAGAWCASVAWYDSKWNPTSGDGIVLSRNLTDPASLASRGITWNAATETPNTGANGPENWQVTGSSFVSGTVDAANPNIIFRVGLQQTFAAYNASSNPARYAVILLGYANNTIVQKIFIRQGEGADYISGTTVKWSPYNVANINDKATYPNGLAAYPTQAGYFYQWGYTTAAGQPPKPLNPSSPSTGAYPSWTSVTIGTAAYALNNILTGYTVPTLVQQQTIVTAYASKIYGYYADGFFDRRQIVQGSDPNSRAGAVAYGTDKVAYIGNLCYNPANNATLFFPATGFRTPTNGSLSNSASDGLYISSTISGSTAQFTNFYPIGVVQNGYNPGYGYSVRLIAQ